jgi:hypothetical protein
MVGTNTQEQEASMVEENGELSTNNFGELYRSNFGSQDDVQPLLELGDFIMSDAL